MIEASYLVAAQGRKDEPVLPHDAVWELLLPIFILCGPQSKCELGELGFTELSERNTSVFNFEVKDKELVFILPA